MAKILIVDDSQTIRKMVRASLRPLTTDFGEAANGLEAIEQLTLAHYDAMTLDLNMPDMHGLEVIQFVRQQPGYQKLPIIVLSTRSDEEIRREVAAAGADNYLVKPFTPTALLEMVRPLLGKATP